MTVTTATEDAASLTSVSSPSARRLYYELAEGEDASPEQLGEAVGYDADRVRDLLSLLDSRGLVTETGGTYSA
ncbi:MAG: hypothetical protein ACQEQY_07050 [Halobacteriota archaeon]